MIYTPVFMSEVSLNDSLSHQINKREMAWDPWDALGNVFVFTCLGFVLLDLAV